MVKIYFRASDAFQQLLTGSKTLSNFKNTEKMKLRPKRSSQSFQLHLNSISCDQTFAGAQ